MIRVKVVYMAENFVDKLKAFLHTAFLVGLDDWMEAGKVPGLRAVEFELFKYYVVRFSDVYINRESSRFDYPRQNFVYGEIPYRVARDIVKTASITGEDIVYDLGCGRGKFLFYVNMTTGAGCFGVDLLPTYIKCADKITTKLKLRDIFFQEEDLVNVDLSDADVVIVHGTCFSRKIHGKIKEKLNRMREGSRLISVTRPYEHPGLKLFDKKKYLLSWGWATIYFYELAQIIPPPSSSSMEGLSLR